MANEKLKKEILEWKCENVETIPENQEFADGVKEGWNSFGTKLFEFLENEEKYFSERNGYKSKSNS